MNQTVFHQLEENKLWEGQNISNRSNNSHQLAKYLHCETRWSLPGSDGSEQQWWRTLKRASSCNNNQSFIFSMSVNVHLQSKEQSCKAATLLSWAEKHLNFHHKGLFSCIWIMTWKNACLHRQVEYVILVVIFKKCMLPIHKLHNFKQ